MLDPRLLRSFGAIADTGSFTQAAERLNMTQSTISQQLGRLEEAVGGALVDRKARPVRLTAIGERLLGYARRMLDLQREAEAMLGDTAGTTSLRIGVPEDIVSRSMAKVFAAFAERHRDVRLDVVAGLSRDLTRRYRAGEFDIVVVKEQLPGPDRRAAYPEAMAWFEGEGAPPSWPDPLPLVTFPPGGLYREAMFERIEREGRAWYVAFSGNSLPSVLTAVEAGLGLAILPVASTAGHALRAYTPFGTPEAFSVSLYSWEATGRTGDLVAGMDTALKERYDIQR